MSKGLLFRTTAICLIAVFALAGQTFADRHGRRGDGADAPSGRVEGRAGGRGIVGPLGSDDRTGVTADHGHTVPEGDRDVIGPLGAGQEDRIEPGDTFRPAGRGR